ncbi:MAG: hypothetical protein IJT48_12065, partial [Bacteroidaceae bacterium]|nr:hypothetical protein [Bacteroidaceae bacterium]
MAKILTLSQATGRLHDSVRDRKRTSSNYIPVRTRRRVDYDLKLRCQQAWNNLDDVRRTRERVKEYVYGDQWGDVIHYKRGLITEREYIQRKGNVPLQNNIMISILNSVVGLYDKQAGEPNCFALKKDGQWLSDMMSATIQANWSKTKMFDVLRTAFTDYTIGGVAVSRETYEEREGRMDAWTDFVNPNYIFWEAGTDPRMTDLRLVGLLYDVSPGELYSKFCNSHYRWTVDQINDIFNIGAFSSVAGTASARYSGLQQNQRDTLDQISFDHPSDNSLYRLIEVWTKESKTRYQCYDPLAHNADEVEYRVELNDIWHVDQANQLRIQQYQEAGVPREEWALIEYERIEDQYWYYTFMANDGTVIAEGETPFEHRSHPFTIRLYPYVNSEVHPFMGTIIDQQRYINRLIIMHDMAARSAAKGITIFPIENIPDGMSKADIAEELTEYDGLLFVQTNKLNPNLRPEIITSNAVQIGTQELLQMELNLARDITNVSGALQGKTPSAGTSAARYNQETENATTSLNSIMADFKSFMESIATKKVMLIKQYYRKGRLIANKDNTNFFEYDNLSARDVDFNTVIKEAAKTTAFQTYVNDTALELLNMQAINVQQYLEVVNLPYAKELLQIIQRDQAQQAALQQQLMQQG